MIRTQVTPGGGGARADISDRATAAIRPVDPAEQAALSDFFAALSVESRYRRFFAPVRPTDGLLDLLSGRPANVDAIIGPSTTPNAFAILDIIAEVDNRVEQVFTEAYADDLVGHIVGASRPRDADPRGFSRGSAASRS